MLSYIKSFFTYNSQNQEKIPICPMSPLGTRTYTSNTLTGIDKNGTADSQKSYGFFSEQVNNFKKGKNISDNHKAGSNTRNSIF